MKKEWIINAVAGFIALVSIGVAIARHGDKTEAVALMAAIPSRADIEVQDAAAAAAEQDLSLAQRELEASRTRWETLNGELKTASAKRDELKAKYAEREKTRKEHMAKLDTLRRENDAKAKRIADARAKAEAEAKAAAEKAAKAKAEEEAKAKAAAEAAKKKGNSSSSRRSNNRNRRRR